jgi:predicted helicase
VIGNPPYNGFAGVSVDEERSLSDAYRWKEGDPDDLKPQGQGLNDLYVRFFRMAERCIVEREPRHGVVCFISNYSWLAGRSFPLMRQRYLNEFDCIRIDNLHGDRIISEYAPDGRTSETVFALHGSSPGIRIGTAITLMVRRNPHGCGAQLLYRDWEQAKAAERRSALLSSLSQANGDETYTECI